MNDRLSQIAFAENNEMRCPVVLLLDTSRSMEGTRIAQLNAGLAKFKTEIMQDSLASLRIEIAIITFGSQVQVVNPRAGDSVVVPFDADQAFVTVENFQPPTLCAYGSTPMGQAARRAIDLIRERKHIYNQHAISYYRPWLFLISDGEPTDAWEAAADEVRREEQQGTLLSFVVGVEEADLQKLGRFSLRPAFKLRGLAFSQLFEWISVSLSRVSRSRSGEQIELPRPDWNVITT